MLKSQKTVSADRLAHRSRVRRGFTLIELLVVVAIITVLIALLMPSLQRARDQAKSVTCLSQLKGIGVAGSSYTAEWDGSLPTNGVRYAGDTGYSSSTADWSSKLKNEGLSSKSLLCPLHNDLVEFYKGPKPYSAASDYALECFLGGVWQRVGTNVPYTPALTRLQSSFLPNGKMWFMEGHIHTSNTNHELDASVDVSSQNTGAAGWPPFGIPWPLQSQGSASDPPPYTHPDHSFNAVYTDGHGENMTRKVYFALTTSGKDALAIPSGWPGYWTGN